MKKLHLYVLLICTLQTATSYCLLPPSNWQPATSNLQPATEKMMQEVYTQLKDAVGDAERTWPILEIRPGANSVLAYNKRKNIIYVDEKALEICQSFGNNERDAFAFLLAHEMTHFYQEHHWQEAGFATSFLTDKHNFDSHVADEKEADLFGTFVTYLAGYQSIKMVPTIFDKVYTAYGLQADLSDYPSLSQRKATALEVCEKVKSLIQIFETANYLTALGEYTSAAAAYEYVLQFVKYKELYNNIGASLVAATALQTDYGKLAFHYPIELDLEIPLRDGIDADKKELLQKAIEYLTLATQLDSRHYATFINLACAYTIDQQYEKTGQLINQLYPIVKNRKQVAELSIIQGIVNAQLNKKTEALRLFEEAKNLSKEKGIQRLATYNSQLVLAESPTPIPSFTATNNEKIGQIDLTYQNDFPFKEITLQDNFSYEEKILGFHKTPLATLTHLTTSDKTLALLITGKPNQLTQKGVGIQATYGQIKKAYPTIPFKAINHSKGYFLVLASLKLFFNLNTQNKVTEWGVYEVY